MLGLGSNISASAPVGASGATQPPREQLVFTYDLQNTNNLNSTISYDETAGGYTNLLMCKDTSGNVYFGLRLDDSFEYLSEDIIRIEYYIPSTNIDVDFLGRLFNGKFINNDSDLIVTDELASHDFVVPDDTSSSYSLLYFTTYDSASVQLSDSITNDLAYVKSVKVYRIS